MTDRGFHVAVWFKLIVLVAGSLLIAACSGSTAPTPSAIPEPTPGDGVVPFTNIAIEALGDNAFVNNWHPGVAIFDYDRDGDMDFYITVADGTSDKPEAPGGPNLLFRNDGGGVYTETAAEAGVDAFASNSTAPAACDFNNDGYQDLYVASYGRIGDGLDYR